MLKINTIIQEKDILSNIKIFLIFLLLIIADNKKLPEASEISNQKIKNTIEIPIKANSITDISNKI